MYHYNTYWYFGVYKKACLSLHFYKKISIDLLQHLSPRLL